MNDAHEAPRCALFGISPAQVGFFWKMASSGGEEDERELSGWSRFFTELMSLLAFSSRRSGSADRQCANYILDRLGIAAQNVSAICDLLGDAEEEGQDQLQELGGRMGNIVNAIHQVIQFWEAHVDTLDRQMERMAYHAPRIYTGQRGRPKFHVTGEQLEYLRSLSFTWTGIASLLCVSRMTIYRRRRAHDFFGEPNTVPTDAELSGTIERICSLAPELGQSLVLGRLRAMGYRVTRERVRDAMKARDPLNTALRMPGGLTSRRKYSVPGPNSLWHIGRHSLVALFSS